MTERTLLIVGGTAGIGLALARDLIADGNRVIVAGRDQARASAAAETLGERATGLAVDLAEPESIADRLRDVGAIQGLVLSAIERDANGVRDYDVSRARRLVTLKLVGYTEVVHSLLDRLDPRRDTGIVLFGGRAKDAPYPGSTTVSTVNGGIESMVRALALDLAPIRVNAIHPGIIGNSPYWSDKAAAIAAYESRTPGGELATVADVVDATRFLLDNKGVSAVNLYVDRGWRVT